MSDTDSLFGSPPPSPSARGRSPSLALPELPASQPDVQASSQNVGTIALPGSHEHCSELPVFIHPALSSEKSSKLSLRPPANDAPPPRLPTRQRVVGPASHRARCPSRVRSPAPHNPQTDRTLRDLVGLISHFEPGRRPSLQLSPPVVPNPSFEGPERGRELHPPGSAQNPIDVDDQLPTDAPRPTTAPGPADAVNSALVALAGTVASALKLPTPPKDVPSLSKPTVKNVLQIIKQDPKLIPVLQATYEYLVTVPSQPPKPPSAFSHDATNDVLPKPKRSTVEKLSQVPAGAGHWNVPFPFAPGQGPKDYPSQWQLDRGRRVLGDLLGLFERAFAQARGNNVQSATATQSRRPKKRRRMNGPESSAQSARSDLDGSVNGTSDQGYILSRSNEASPFDRKWMNEWLSSVPDLSRSSSIVESTSAIPSPSPSDPAPVSDGMQDLLAMLGPNSANPNAATVDDKNLIFDFEAAFSDVGLQGDVQWEALLGSGPTSQSTNDIAAFPMGSHRDLASESLIPQPQLQPSHHQSSEIVIDPVLMALSHQQTTGSSSSSILDATSYGQSPSSDLNLPFAASTSSITSNPQCHLNPETRGLCVSNCEGADNTNQSDSHSVVTTIPTMSISSSQECSRDGSLAPTDMHVSSVAPSKVPSRAQRKEAVLAKARQHRARLVKAMEEAKTERWETVIEGGVLRNLQEFGVP